MCGFILRSGITGRVEIAELKQSKKYNMLANVNTNQPCTFIKNRAINYDTLRHRCVGNVSFKLAISTSNYICKIVNNNAQSFEYTFKTQTAIGL